MSAASLKITIGSICLTAILIGGCRKAAEPQATTTKPTVSSAVNVEPVGLVAAESVSDSISVKEVVASGEATPIEQNAKEQTSSPAESKERILLLAPGGPLIIDFVLTIDGRPHTEALSQLVDEVLKLSDADGDGRTMWKELCACERVKYGQFGNLPIDGENSEKQIIERYDVARDGVVDRSELPRFLTRNAGSSRPFSIRGTLDHRGSNRNLSATWRILDANGDGIIDAVERKSASARLADKDADDDEMVAFAELNPRRQTPEPDMMMADRRRRGPDGARVLGEHADWISVQRALEQTYAGGRTIRRESCPFWAEVLEKLDANADGRLASDEIKRLNDVAAQIVVEVGFGVSPDAALQPTPIAADESNDAQQTTGDRDLPRLKLRFPLPSSAEKSFLVTEGPGQLTISRADSRLTIATNDTVARSDYTAQAKQALQMFDQNKDGYLERSEVPDGLQGRLGRFEAVDADGDGKAYPHEIEAFLSQQQAGLRAQIHARVSDAEDLLFLALDVNQDQRLDSREIQHAGERLSALAATGEGDLTPDELPEAITIVLARGSVETPDVTFAVRPATPLANDKKTPRWFTAMDANGDGVISRREFLGTAEQFARLDRDSSGLLEPTEAGNDQ